MGGGVGRSKGASWDGMKFRQDGQEESQFKS